MVPGSGTNPFRIPDPGVKKEPYPGSGSALNQSGSGSGGGGGGPPRDGCGSGTGLDWMVDTAGYGSGISGSGSQTYIFESILKIYWVKTNNFLNIGPNICQHFRCDFFWT
jgi:hypothetical protein